MWPNTKPLITIILVTTLLSFNLIHAQRQRENLGRGMVAIHQGDGMVYVGWRMLGTDPDDIAFNLYRSTGGGRAVKLNDQPITQSTNHVDNGVDFTDRDADQHDWPKDIESFRQEQLAPVIKQEQKLLSAIDRSYNQIHYANSIVTGHLSSIARVRDAQEQILKEFGIEDLSKDIGETLAETSRKVSEYTDQAKKIDEELEETAKKINDWKTKFNTLFRTEGNES